MQIQKWARALSSEPSAAGRIGRKLTDDEKYALIEYLKSANYENYPRIKVAKEQAVPCADDKNWPKRFSVRPAR